METPRFKMLIENLESRVDALAQEMESLRRQMTGVMNALDVRTTQLDNQVHICLELATMALELAEHVSPDKAEALSKLKELAAKVELTEAQHIIFQPVLNGLLGRR